MSATYPIIDEELDNIIISFQDLDWEYWNVSGLIHELKRDIPKENRDYDPQTRRWAVDGTYRHVAMSLIKKYFG